MSILDINHIVNGTPKKRLNNSYKKMKENYTAESAQEYYDVYSQEPLSFLLENSDMIFSEPYYGTSYFEKVISNDLCCFTSLEKESEMFESYLEENGSKMGTEQRKLCDSLKTVLEAVSVHTKNTQLYASYIKENIDKTFEEKLSEAIYAYEKSEDKDNTEIMKVIESVESPIIFFTYAPYIVEKVDTELFNNMANSFLEKSEVPESYDEQQWKTYVETVICCNKLSNDDYYVNAVRNIPNRNTRNIFEYFMNASLNDKIEELVTEKVSADIHHASTVSAINNIFTDIYEAEIDKEENDLFKEHINTYKGIAYESTLNMIIEEYQLTSNTENSAKGYSLLTESMSLNDAFNYINNLYTESGVYTEAEYDVSDDDIDSMNNNINDREIGGQVPGKKPVAPKPKNLANKVQFKAMDAEAKQRKKQAIRAQKGQEISNAVKAVTNLPMNVIKSIKGMVKTVDETDDERRKNYMTEPGFRKKALRNLKLAIIYGSAAEVKLAFVPVVAICRHFSKKKDQRIRNELTRELNTEIKVCEEKINDANAAGDTKEKYRLMRIKDQLEAEMVRVETNSNYV